MECSDCEFACRLVTAPHPPDYALLAVKRSDLEDFLAPRKLLPPLIIRFAWEEKGGFCEKVVFYPFVAYRFLKDETTDPIWLTPKNAGDVAVYSNMFELPCIELSNKRWVKAASA